MVNNNNQFNNKQNNNNNQQPKRPNINWDGADLEDDLLNEFGDDFSPDVPEYGYSPDDDMLEKGLIGYNYGKNHQNW